MFGQDMILKATRSTFAFITGIGRFLRPAAAAAQVRLTGPVQNAAADLGRAVQPAAGQIAQEAGQRRAELAAPNALLGERGADGGLVAAGARHRRPVPSTCMAVRGGA